MALNQQVANLIDTTVNAFNGTVAGISPTDGITLINSWLSALHNDDQAVDSVASDLHELKTELQQGNPDEAHIRQLLNELAEQAKQAAGSADTDVQTKLRSLVDGLQGFRQQLGGSSQRVDNQDQQAPMTSTVGGESTNSGTGASAFRTNNDDDLANRSGGTVDAGGPTIDMDDQTGSDGGHQRDNSDSQDDDYRNAESSGASSGSRGSGATESSDTDAPRTGSASIGGSGISGGAGDTDSSQSGGRSQY